MKEEVILDVSFSILSLPLLIECSKNSTSQLIFQICISYHFSLLQNYYSWRNNLDEKRNTHLNLKLSHIPLVLFIHDLEIHYNHRILLEWNPMGPIFRIGLRSFGQSNLGFLRRETLPYPSLPLPSHSCTNLLSWTSNLKWRQSRREDMVIVWLRIGCLDI